VLGKCKRCRYNNSLYLSIITSIRFYSVCCGLDLKTKQYLGQTSLISCFLDFYKIKNRVQEEDKDKNNGNILLETMIINKQQNSKASKH